MRTESSAPPFRAPAITDLGVLFLYSPNLGLRVRYGSLVVDLGGGRSFTIDRAGEPRLKRLVIAGHGWWTFEVASWLQGIGASWLQLDLTGRILGQGPGGISPDLPALRRAQALSSRTELGVAIGRDLLKTKLANQSAALEQIPGAASAREIVLNRLRDLDGCVDAGALRVVEALAAGAFWGALATLPMDYVTADRSLMPGSWRRVGRRASLVTGASRGATSPAHGLWNFAYAIAAAEVEVGLRAVGLDPGISPTGLHADTANRSGATWDVLEATRGQVDLAIIAMITGRRFRRRDFAQLPDGRVRLTAPLARELAEVILPLARAAAAPVCEWLGRTLADGVAGPSSHMCNLPSNLTGDARSTGRDGIRKGARKTPRTPVRSARALVPRACRRCGVIFEEGTRRGNHCVECLPSVRANAEAALIAAGRGSLASMRARSDDPARSAEAKAKMGRANARHVAEARDWERTHERPDPAEWEAIAAGLGEVSVRAIQRATGLSPASAWRIKRGERRAHPRHWEALRSLS
jgi:hypothetical protein